MKKSNRIITGKFGAMFHEFDKIKEILKSISDRIAVLEQKPARSITGRSFLDYDLEEKFELLCDRYYFDPHNFDEQSLPTDRVDFVDFVVNDFKTYLMESEIFELSQLERNYEALKLNYDILHKKHKHLLENVAIIKQ